MFLVSAPDRRERERERERAHLEKARLYPREREHEVEVEVRRDARVQGCVVLEESDSQRGVEGVDASRVLRKREKRGRWMRVGENRRERER